MSLHYIPWKSSTYSPWPGRQQPCNWWALLFSSKSTRSDECIHADDTDLFNDCGEKKKRQLQLVTPSFFQFNLQINDTKTVHTVLKRRDKKNEYWRSTKKLGSLIKETYYVENSLEQPFITWITSGSWKRE